MKPFSNKSSIFLLCVLGMVLFLSLFAKSTMNEGFTTSPCMFIVNDNARQKACFKEESRVRAEQKAAEAAAKAAEAAAKAKVEAEARAKLNAVIGWAKGVGGNEWYKTCNIDYDKTKHRDVVYAECKDTSGKYKKTEAHYRDCIKKNGDSNGNVIFKNSNGKFQCG